MELSTVHTESWEERIPDGKGILPADLSTRGWGAVGAAQTGSAHHSPLPAFQGPSISQAPGAGGRGKLGLTAFVFVSLHIKI